jgi:hypothetical protein
MIQSTSDNNKQIIRLTNYNSFADSYEISLFQYLKNIIETFQFFNNNKSKN